MYHDQHWQFDIRNRKLAGRSHAAPASAPSSQRPRVSFRPLEPPLDSGGRRDSIFDEGDLGEGSSQLPRVVFRPLESPYNSGGERELSELVFGEDDLGEGWDFSKERR